MLTGAPLPDPVATELRFLSTTLLHLSDLQGQGRSLASLVVACRQLWLSPATVPNADKAALLDAPISLGHTFGPAVEEILQRSLRQRKASQQWPHCFLPVLRCGGRRLTNQTCCPQQKSGPTLQWVSLNCRGFLLPHTDREGPQGPTQTAHSAVNWVPQPPWLPRTRLTTSAVKDLVIVNS
ncbi:UNVERIFIED_CONTAM: hypothetical protein FKN15_049425 [Acipenser sinensis]